jgi:hypothetical protein
MGELLPRGAAELVFWLEELEKTVDIWPARIVSWLPSGSPAVESAPSPIGDITLEVKSTGKPGAGKPHAGFDAAGAGNVTMGAGLRAPCESCAITTGPYCRRSSPRSYL